jgi:ribose transport system substrate-binding protein
MNGFWRSASVRPLVVAIGISALMLATGCGSDDSGGGGSSSGGGGKKTVALVHGLAGLEYYNTLVCGAKKAATEEGVNLTVDAPKKYDPTEQTQVIKSVMLKKPDGFVIIPTDAVALNPLFDQVSKQAPLITADGIPSREIGIANIRTDGAKGGGLGAEYMAKKLGDKKGYVLVLGTTPTTTQTVARSMGFIEKMKEINPNVEVSKTQYTGGSDAAVAARIVANQLQAHPDMVGIFAPFEAAANGASSALAAAKKEGVSLVGFDASPQEVQNLRRGVFDALVVQAPFEQGYSTVKQMAEVVKGKLDPKSVKYVQYSPVILASHENMDEPDIKKYLEPGTC